MTKRKPANKGTQKSSKSTTASGKKVNGFTDEEKAAMRPHLQRQPPDVVLKPTATQATINK